MKTTKKIFAISGSTRSNSSNLKILKQIAELSKDLFEVKIFENLAEIPHFNPDLDTENPPQQVTNFRNEIQKADGIIICTPEYVFSLPGSLKNALEWCVSTTIFSKKKVGLITASASGEKGHEELQLIMKTIEASFNADTSLLIQGVRGKVNAEGVIVDNLTLNQIQEFIVALDNLLWK
ncbi:NADPH-dependent FMN reductase [Flavobacterium soyangense]|uniref:NAD(P)H-dependent oxidoreductase n=1 Tax=Flavobacterium soyangense TaxID=2023265 RepID=A0A930UCV8_9FLAO|nr:NAD(P)H-dependent oxidoreductase [Flavobacterium soyangense]MBF2709867.1 NAD(P)H-dependent oxidoreductase [Flavobacterium soyangense]